MAPAPLRALSRAMESERAVYLRPLQDSRDRLGSSVYTGQALGGREGRGLGATGWLWLGGMNHPVPLCRARSPVSARGMG